MRLIVAGIAFLLTAAAPAPGYDWKLTPAGWGPVRMGMNREHVATFGTLFAAFVAGLEALYASYTDEQLAVILDFLRRSAAIQRDATGELTSQT